MSTADQVNMAAVECRVLYDFVGEAEGELTVRSDEILHVTRQDVGDGWFEVVNKRGQQGLVPESYLEITSVPEPQIPLPPTPVFNQTPAYHQQPQTQPPPGRTSWQPQSHTAAPPVAQARSTSYHPSNLPAFKQPAPPSDPSPASTGSQGNGYQPSVTTQESYDDWDDDWDDDDDSSTNTEVPEMPYEGSSTKSSKRNRPTSLSDDKKFGTVRKPFNRFSQFNKAGGDAYLFDMSPVNVPESERRIVIMEDSLGNPCWKPNAEQYSCYIRSPKKESKYRGIKSFIAYQITPTFSNIQVSRRYKHFDWLHERLVEKFSCVAIPPLPEKQISGRFEEDFINQRLRLLQLWMDRMCKHPVVAQSEVILHFLSCTDEKRWKSGKRRSEKDDYLGGKFFFTVQTPPHALDAKVVEQQMERFGRFVKSMDDSAKHLLTVCDNSVRKYQTTFRKEHMKIGGSFIALAKSFEFDERQEAQGLTRAMENCGKIYEDIGKLYAKQPERDVKHLMEGLTEYRGLLSTFPDILAVQRAATQKIQESAGRLGDSELATVQGRADVISYATQAEMTNFQTHRVPDFKNYMTAFITGQIQFHQEITAKLQDALQHLEIA